MSSALGAAFEAFEHPCRRQIPRGAEWSQISCAKSDGRELGGYAESSLSRWDRRATARFSCAAAQFGRLAALKALYMEPVPQQRTVPDRPFSSPLLAHPPLCRRAAIVTMRFYKSENAFESFEFRESETGFDSAVASPGSWRGRTATTTVPSASDRISNSP